MCRIVGAVLTVKPETKLLLLIAFVPWFTMTTYICTLALQINTDCCGCPCTLSLLLFGYNEVVDSLYYTTTRNSLPIYLWGKKLYQWGYKTILDSFLCLYSDYWLFYHCLKSSSRMLTTSHSMLLKILMAISSVNGKSIVMETILRCRLCVRCTTGQSKSISTAQVKITAS